MRRNIFISVKSFVDFILSLVLLPLVLFVVLLAGIFIWIEDKGPVFYLSERVGKNGEVFKMFKLRSMYVNAPQIRKPDGSVFSNENDSRITKVGKFLRKTSLDELPQIFNVLKGDMSFIGPRPSTPYWLTICQKKHIEILNLKPGITGYNQAYFRNSVSDDEKYDNDLYYVRNISLRLDLKIIFKTAKSVLLREKIY